MQPEFFFPTCRYCTSLVYDAAIYLNSLSSRHQIQPSTAGFRICFGNILSGKRSPSPGRNPWAVSSPGNGDGHFCRQKAARLKQSSERTASSMPIPAAALKEFTSALDLYFHRNRPELVDVVAFGARKKFLIESVRAQKAHRTSSDLMARVLYLLNYVSSGA